MKHGVTYLILILLTLATVQAQPDAATVRGNDFWVTFLYNYHETASYNPGQLGITCIGDQSCNVNVSSPTGSDNLFLNSGNGFHVTHVVGDNNNMPVATVYNGGYHITSSSDIWLYARNYIRGTQDIAAVVPTALLDTAYIVQDYPSWNYGSQVAFVATENNTTLTMTVPCDIQGASITAGTTLTLTLMAGQSYYLVSDGNSSSFTGMRVVSNGKPFAAFQGGRRVLVPQGGSGSDMLFEQILPTRLWGTEFIVPGAAAQNGYNYVRITSSEDSCVVSVDGASPITLMENATAEYSIPTGGVKHISATKPVCVILYLTSYNTAGSTGDPSSVTIAPINGGVYESRFRTQTTIGIDNNSHYLNIVCDTSWSDSLLLDGQAPANFTATSSLYGRYRVYRVQVAGDMNHHLLNSSGPFVAYAYGLGYYESYAFSLGFNPVSGRIHDTVECHDTVCQYESFEGCGFSIDSGETATAGALERWRQAVGNDTVHHYHLSLVVRSVADSVVEGQITRGDTLFFHGDTLTAAGNYLYSLTAANGCDSIVRLHLMYSMDTIEYYDTVCQGQAYSGYGFNITTTQTAGTRAYWDDWGDSLCRYCLWLTVLPISYTDTTVCVFMGDTVFHDGDTLVDTGAYTTIYTAANGCDSVFTLHLRYEEMRLEASADGICPGDSVTLTAIGTHTAWWVSTPPDETLAGQQEMTTIVVRPQQSTTYCLFSREGGEMIGCIDVGVEAPPELCVQLSIPIIDFDYPVVHFNDCSESGVVSNWTFSEYGISAGEDVTVSQRKVMRKFQHPLPDSVVVTLQSCNQYHCCADTVFCVPTKIRSVWWPNVFTPGEEQNNRFGCVTSIDIVEYELFIYNRLGLQVFHSADPTAAWDGTCEGVPVQQGAYVYRWYIRDVYGSLKNGVGTVTLIR